MESFQTNPDQFFLLIGKKKEDEIFKLFQKEFHSETSEQNIPQGKIVLYKEDGISVKIVYEMITSIKFYLSPNPICMVYEGQNIFNLNRNVDETQVRKNDDYQIVINNDPNRLANDYSRLNCLFSFDSMTGEFLTIEILNEA